MSYLQFPHDRQLLSEPVLVQRLQLDDVRELRDRFISWAAREALDLDVGHRPRGAPNLDDLSWLWERW